MIQTTVLILFVLGTLYGVVQLHPDLDTFISHMSEKCCNNEICTLNNSCANDLRYLTLRCGKSWTHLRDTNFTLDDVTERCYYGFF